MNATSSTSLQPFLNHQRRPASRPALHSIRVMEALANQRCIHAHGIGLTDRQRGCQLLYVVQRHVISITLSDGKEGCRPCELRKSQHQAGTDVPVQVWRFDSINRATPTLQIDDCPFKSECTPDLFPSDGHARPRSLKRTHDFYVVRSICHCL